jgi:pilus assembly protein Flp/PilA
MNWLRRRRVNDLGQNEQGQGLVEYGLITAIVSIAALGALTTLGGQIVATLYEPVANMFP